MNNDSILTLNQKASIWADQLRIDPSYTITDIEELKGHLLDISEDLVLKGLSVEDAFAVATTRIGDPSLLRTEFEEINTPVIQLRKATLVLSGVLAFFLLYYFIFATTHLLVLVMNHFSDDYVLNYRLVVSYIMVYPLLIAIATSILLFRHDKKFKLLEKINVRPKHTFFLFLGLLLLSFSGEWFRNLCEVKFDMTTYTRKHLYNILLYLNVFLPFVFMVSFVTLHRKYGRSTSSRLSASNNDLLLIFSSVLVYFFLLYFMGSISMIMIYLLQHYQNDPVLNIRRTLSFVISYQWCFVLLTATLYFLDKNIVQRIKRLHVKPIHTLWMFLATIFFAFTELMASALAKNSLGKEMEFRLELRNVRHISEHTFPVVLCACFLVLFYKYYRDNVRIGS